MDRFFALTVFTKVVEAGSFAQAARILDVSPACVTEQIQALEVHLQTKLLRRTTRSMSLTDEGAAYYEQACRILANLEEADAMLSAQRASPKGLLRVAMPQMLATRVVLPALPRLLDRFPELSVELTLSAQAPSFSAQSLDLALQITKEVDPGLVFRPLGLCPVCTVASPAYLQERGRPQALEDLDGHRIISVRAQPGLTISSLMRFERNGQMVSYDPKSRVFADSGEAQRQFAISGAGISQCALYAVASALEAGELVRLLTDWEWTGPPLGAVYPPSRFLQPKVSAFLQFVEEILVGKVAPYRADWVKF